MVFTIREESATGTVIFSTGTVLVNNVAPAIFFDKESFEHEDKPVWSENSALQREGNFSHYNGSNDSTMRVNAILYGPDRDTNLATVKGIKSVVFYLDASDIDSSLSGTYVVDRTFRITYFEAKQYIKMSMLWRKYNN